MKDKFENVTAIAKANVYFDGKVISHAIYTAQGERKTLGLFMPGEYEFGTEAAEIMDITDGVCRVKLPNASEFVEVKAGESFNVPENSKYKLSCDAILQYVCSYVGK
ncbi:MAG: pyrimidine/purine nucleoside phosphorylase [Synergistaceae bacterium]|nr:pyrimidine/purine nucleoside phosphorylase [Synergistaceae bacterium]